jgi:hypothetical protein
MTDNHSTAQQSPSLGLEMLVAGATMVGCGEAPANTRKTKASTGIGLGPTTLDRTPKCESVLPVVQGRQSCA